MAYTPPSLSDLRSMAGTGMEKLYAELVKIQTAIADAAQVDKGEIPAGFLKVVLATGGAAGDITVSGIAVGDELVFVGVFDSAADIATLTDLTSEFAVAAGKINNAEGTATTGATLQVIYIDRT